MYWVPLNSSWGMNPRSLSHGQDAQAHGDGPAELLHLNQGDQLCQVVLDDAGAQGLVAVAHVVLGHLAEEHLVQVSGREGGRPEAEAQATWLVVLPVEGRLDDVHLWWGRSC